MCCSRGSNISSTSRCTPARHNSRWRCGTLTSSGGALPCSTWSGWLTNVITVGTACSADDISSSWCSSRWWPRCTPSNTPTETTDLLCCDSPWLATRSSASSASRPSIRRISCPGPVLLFELLQLGFDPDLLARGQPVREQHAVEVVHLVLDDAREPVLGLQRLLLAIEILVGDRHRDPALDLGADAGKGQATLLFEGASLLARDLRVAEHTLLRTIGAIARGVQDQQLLLDADLRSREPDPTLVVHRLEHLAGELAQLGVELRDGLAASAQDRIGVD